MIDHDPVDQHAVEARRRLGSFLRWRTNYGLFDSVRPCRARPEPSHAAKPPCSRIAASFRSAARFDRLSARPLTDDARAASQRSAFCGAAHAAGRGFVRHDRRSWSVATSPFSIDCAAAHDASSPSGSASMSCAASQQIEAPTARPGGLLGGRFSSARRFSPRPAVPGPRTRAPPRPRAPPHCRVPAHFYDRLRIAAGAPPGGLDFAYADVFPHDADLTISWGRFRRGLLRRPGGRPRMERRGTARRQSRASRKRAVRTAPGRPSSTANCLSAHARLLLGTRSAYASRIPTALRRRQRRPNVSASGVGFASADKQAGLIAFPRSFDSREALKTHAINSRTRVTGQRSAFAQFFSLTPFDLSLRISSSSRNRLKRWNVRECRFGRNRADSRRRSLLYLLQWSA